MCQRYTNFRVYKPWLTQSIHAVVNALLNSTGSAPSKVDCIAVGISKSFPHRIVVVVVVVVVAALSTQHPNTPSHHAAAVDRRFRVLYALPPPVETLGVLKLFRPPLHFTADKVPRPLPSSWNLAVSVSGLYSSPSIISTPVSASPPEDVDLLSGISFEMSRQEAQF
jgi:hypothetical protein